MIVNYHRPNLSAFTTCRVQPHCSKLRPRPQDPSVPSNTCCHSFRHTSPRCTYNETASEPKRNTIMLYALNHSIHALISAPCHHIVADLTSSRPSARHAVTLSHITLSARQSAMLSNRRHHDIHAPVSAPCRHIVATMTSTRPSARHAIASSSAP